jgi:hypothetical protein
VFLCRKYRELWAERRKAHKLSHGQSKAYYYGLSKAISERIERERKEKFSHIQCNALMVVNDQLEEAFKKANPDMKYTQTYYQNYKHVEQMAAQDADKIRLRDAVAEDKKTLLGV